MSHPIPMYATLDDWIARDAIPSTVDSPASISFAKGDCRLIADSPLSRNLWMWPAGSQLTQTLGSRYAVIAMALGMSEENGVIQPEPGTLEARLTEAGRAMFIPTHRGQGMPTEEIEALPRRSGSKLNPTYFPLSSQSFTDFDCLVVFDSTNYPRGGPSLTSWNAD